MIDQHIDLSLEKLRAIFKKASLRVESLTPDGEGLAQTALAEELAAEIGMTSQSLYHILKFLWEGYPYLECRKGARGGLYKLSAPKVVELNNQDKDSVPEKEPLPIINT